MAKFNLHSSNVTYIVICLLGMIAFFFVGIFPNFAALDDMDDEIAALQKKIQTQELLFPVYRKLVNEVVRKVPTGLSVPKQEKIAANDMARLNKTFSELAQECQVVFSSAAPDARNYLEDTGYLTFKVDFIGDFFNLRQLLLKVCQLPYLESIDQMRIETLRQQKRMSFLMKIAQR